MIRNKARLVAHGHRHEEGIDYEEVFAPVARIKAIRLFLAYASFMGFLVYQMDVKSAFLYETIEEEVYVTQPPGFKDPNYPDKVYKVVKALYGLHQAPRECHDKYVGEILKKFNYTDVKSASTPVDLEKPLVKDGDADDVDVHLYRSMIGSLMYLTASRPDIMFACLTLVDVMMVVFHLNGINDFCYLTVQEGGKLGVLNFKQTIQTFHDASYKADQKGGFLQTGRSLIEELDLDAEISLIPTHAADQGRIDDTQISDQPEEQLVSTADVSTVSELGSTVGVKGKDKGIAIMQSSRQNKNKRSLILKQPLNCQKQLDKREEVVSSAYDFDWSDLVMLRYHTLQNRPFSVAKVRKNMFMYLKNQGGYKLSHFKGMSYEDIRHIFKRVWDQNQAFVPKDSEIEKEVMKRSGFDLQQEFVKKDEASSFVQKQPARGSRKKSLARKRARETLSEESAKKQKLEDESEKRRTSVYLTIVQKLKVFIFESLANIVIPIVDRETQILANDKYYYQIKRADGSVKHYKIFSAMLYDFDRQDVMELYKLVKERFQTASPEGYDLLLWGDLKTMIEPNEEDEIWRNQQDWNLINWKLHNFCGVHVLLMDTGFVIHMMVEKKYPLSQDTLSKMLSRRLEVDHQSEMGYELIRRNLRFEGLQDLVGINIPTPGLVNTVRLNLMLPVQVNVVEELEKNREKILDLEKAKTAQANKITSLKKRVKHLGAQEDASKQGKKLKILMLIEEEIKFEKVVEEPVVSVATSTKSIPVRTAEVVTTASASIEIPDELTLAQILIEIKTAKPKLVTTAPTTVTFVRPRAKGIIFMIRRNKVPDLQTTFSSHNHNITWVKARTKEKLVVLEQREAYKEKGRRSQHSFDRIIGYQTKAIWRQTLELAEVQAEEQGEITIEERSRLFVELMNKRKKHFVKLRAEGIRRKPPNKAQKKNQMYTYLKNMAGYKHSQLKSKSYDEIQKLFDKEMKRVNTFVDMNSEVVKGSETRTKDSSKRAGDELESNKSKKQKIDEHVEVEKDDQEGTAINKDRRMGYFKLIRADGSSKRLEEDYEIVLWGDLKVMFEPDIKSEVWRNLQGCKVTVWKMFNNYGVALYKFRILHFCMLVEKQISLNTNNNTQTCYNRQFKIIVGMRCGYQSTQAHDKARKGHEVFLKASPGDGVGL
ncbi:putative ribonuclease H-like domain-containing protein [Tanacetum coccineum]|uniref:Ribonuclease H-like domain-containing protein n=1 Tax=Tanacetum coccineum TaxID=301880 RepID=A0ABQ4YGL0_9ASTR